MKTVVNKIYPNGLCQRGVRVIDTPDTHFSNMLALCMSLRGEKNTDDPKTRCEWGNSLVVAHTGSIYFYDVDGTSYVTVSPIYDRLTHSIAKLADKVYDEKTRGLVNAYASKETAIGNLKCLLRHLKSYTPNKPGFRKDIWEYNNCLLLRNLQIV